MPAGKHVEIDKVLEELAYVRLDVERVLEFVSAFVLRYYDTILMELFGSDFDILRELLLAGMRKIELLERDLREIKNY